VRRAALWVLPAALLGLAAGCNYARMQDDDALDTYESALPAAPRGTVPVTGGVEAIRSADPAKLANPVAAGPAAVEQGRSAYAHYCLQCHGPLLDGNGTVGQSFAPLPTDLRSRAVLDQPDGRLFSKVSFGFARHPPLAETVEERDRWAILRYLRALGPREAPPPGRPRG
jgi:mono/diheme cytochrome c family protein